MEHCVLLCFLEYRTMDEVQEPSNPEQLSWFLIYKIGRLRFDLNYRSLKSRIPYSSTYFQCLSVNNNYEDFKEITY
jgi:hypothetical protein